MDSSWMDDLLGDDFLPEDDGEGFYCPYTNGPECALITKGWQPQEICGAIECEQLTLFHRNAQRRGEAA